MNAREVAAAIAAAFRASPVREGGSEALYSTHQLRACLELLFEELERLADELTDAGQPPPRSRPRDVAGAWLELLQVTAAIEQRRRVKESGT